MVYACWFLLCCWRLSFAASPYFARPHLVILQPERIIVAGHKKNRLWRGNNGTSWRGLQIPQQAIAAILCAFSD